MEERRFDLQFFGGGGSRTEQVRKRDPEPEELKRLREQIYGITNPGLQYLEGNLTRDQYDNEDFWRIIDQSKEAEDKAIGFLDQVGSKWGLVDEGLADHKAFQGQYQNFLGDFQSMLGRQEKDNAAFNDMYSGYIKDYGRHANEYQDYLGDYRDFVDEYQNFVKTGVPQAIQDSIYQGIMRNAQKDIGGMINAMAGRGVVNSTVGTQGIDSIQGNAMDAMIGKYLDTYNAVNQGYMGVGQNWNALGDQHYKSGLTWNDLGNQYLGWGNLKNNQWNTLGQNYNAVGNQYNNLGNQKLGYIGQANQYASGFDQSMMGAYDKYMGMPTQLWENYYAPGQAGYQFWKDWQASYDGREDYDTVVHQGK